jgi:hypothetical protein
MENSQITPQDVQKLEELITIVRNIEADINNAVNNSGLFKLSPMSNGKPLVNLSLAVDKVVSIVNDVLRKDD